MTQSNAQLRSGRALILAAAIAVAVLAWVVAPAQASARGGLTLGIVDPWSLQLGRGLDIAPIDPAERALWLDRARSARAGILQFGAVWTSIAPRKPTPSFDATNPADPEYNWSELDGAIRDASARGLTPKILVAHAPDWAEGPNRPAGFEIPAGPEDVTTAPGGTWKPDPGAVGDFGQAVARRFSGTFTDPANPGAGPLPRVRYFQLWPEPNLGVYLNPRYENGEPFAANHYRQMLRRFWDGVHSVSKKNKVITGGTSPYGDHLPEGRRTPPAEFWRDLLCLKGKKLKKKKKCGKPAKFDIAAHNAINVGPPRQKATGVDDVSTPDVKKITRILKKAKKSGQVRPKGKKPVWVTELWWDSNPPDPSAPDRETQARYLSEGMYLLWKQGVSAAFWFLIRDLAPPLGPSSWSSGLYDKAGVPKPALSAFRFPFAVDKRKKGKAKLWGIAPSKGKVTIERQAGAGWKKIGKAKAGKGRVFFDEMRVPKAGTLRARKGSEASLGWEL